jgi:hypothetical protein
MRTRTFRTVALAAALGLALASCGDDDDDDAESTTTTTEEEAADESTTTTTAEEGGDDEFAEICAVAEEIDANESLPTPDQLERYVAAAPAELADAAETAAAPLIEADGDLVAGVAAIAEDDVSAAVDELNAFEEENCGIDHSDDSFSGEEEPAAGSTEVQVSASEYSFDIPEGIAAGPTAFVLTNPGAEAHHIVLLRVEEGHTLDEALQFEGDPEAEGIVTSVGGSGLAAPGGEDTEVANVELEAGEYGMLCFIPGPDGSPHAFSGMAVPFTVS